MAYDPVLALQLAVYADDAYYAYRDDAFFAQGYQSLTGLWRQNQDRQAWLTANNYQLIVNPQGTTPDARYFGIVASTADSVIVAFRGTDTMGDIAIDALGGGISPDSNLRISFPFEAWTVAGSTPWLHKNFLDTYNGFQASVRQTVKALFDANPALTKLYVTGHSLGAGLGSICALDLATSICVTDSKVPRPRLYTFASPLAGDQTFANLVVANTIECYRINQSNDWVTGVPTQGWTPAWLTWWYGGKVGPEPTKFAPFIHAGTSVPVSTTAYFPWSHTMSNYYGGCVQLKPYVSNPQLHPADPVTQLVVRIKTANKLGAGTDNDVYVGLMGVVWGPLDKPGENDFEAGSVGVYDLFAMFPNLKPAAPICADINSLSLILGDGVFYFSVWNMAWDPEWVEIDVNGKVLTSVALTGTLTWSTSRTFTTAITVQ